MNCSRCNTPVVLRPIVFGDLGYLRVMACQCAAARMTLKYAAVKDEGSVKKRRKR